MKQKVTQAPGQLPMVHLKTKLVTFDDRLQQVRIVPKDSKGRIIGPKGPVGPIKFLNYDDDEGFYYVKKYRPNWADVIRL